MEMNLTRDGVLHLNIFDVETQEDQDQFIYYYMGLPRSVKKKFENAYYALYTKGLLAEAEAQVIHTNIDGVTHIEVHPNDILKNLRIIKQFLSGEEFLESFYPTKTKESPKPKLVVVGNEHE